MIWKTPYKKGDRPVEVSGKPHNCPKYEGGGGGKSNNVQYKTLTKYDYEKCPYCKGTNGGYCRKGTDEMEWHIYCCHPNGEIRYDDDYGNKKERGKWHRPCYYCGTFNLYDTSLLNDDNDPKQFHCEDCHS
jgi:hypothetical protein